VFSVWVTGCSSPINAEVRRILGLMYTCGWTRDQVRRRLILSEAIIDQIFDAIDEDTSPEVAEMKANGITLDDAVDVMAREQALCKCCHAVLSIVPCVTCSLEGTADEPWQDEEDLPESPEPTDSLPGTLERLLVMRERAAKGFSVFCSNDRPETMQLPWCA